MDKLFFYIGDMIKEAGHVFFCIDGITRFMCVSGRLSYAEKIACSESAHVHLEKRGKG